MFCSFLSPCWLWIYSWIEERFTLHITRTEAKKKKKKRNKRKRCNVETRFKGEDLGLEVTSEWEEDEDYARIAFARLIMRKATSGRFINCAWLFRDVAFPPVPSIPDRYYATKLRIIATIILGEEERWEKEKLRTCNGKRGII